MQDVRGVCKPLLRAISGGPQASPTAKQKGKAPAKRKQGSSPAGASKAKSKGKRARSKKQWGEGQSLGDGTEQEPDVESTAEAGAHKKRRVDHAAPSPGVDVSDTNTAAAAAEARSATNRELDLRREDMDSMAQHHDLLLDLTLKQWIPRLEQQFEAEPDDATDNVGAPASAAASGQPVGQVQPQQAPGGDGSGGAAESATADDQFSVEEAHGSYLEFYITVCIELVYLFRAEPEQANELDPAWARDTLAPLGIDMSDVTDAELETYFDDAAKIYEEYEEQKIAQLLLEHADQMESCNVAWIRRQLGYTTPPPSADDAFAIKVWIDMWENAKLAIAEREKSLSAATNQADAGPAAAEADLLPAEAVPHPSQLHAPHHAERYSSTADSTIGSAESFPQTDALLRDPAFKVELDLEDSTDPLADTEAAVGVSLVRALAAEGDNQVKKAFQSALHSRQAEAKAEGKYQASLAGNMVYTLNQTRGLRGEEHTYLNAKTSRGRPSVDETVQLIPYQTLVAVVHSIAVNPDEAVRDKLHPVPMALTSPRVFWNICYHEGVGPTVSFAKACQELIPSLDWKKLFERRKKLKYDSLEWAM